MYGWSQTETVRSGGCDMRTMRTALVSLLACGWALGALGAPPARQPEGPGEKTGAGLSRAERDTLRKLAFEHEREMIPLRADARLARLELRRLLSEPKPDEAAVMKAAEAVAQAELAVEKSRLKHLLRVREVLGPERAARLGPRWAGRFEPPRGPEACEKRWRRRAGFGRAGGDMPHRCPAPIEDLEEWED